MLKTMGSTSRGNFLIIVNVVISNATRDPGVNNAPSKNDLLPVTYLGPLDALTMTATSSTRIPE